MRTRWVTDNEESSYIVETYEHSFIPLRIIMSDGSLRVRIDAGHVTTSTKAPWSILRPNMLDNIRYAPPRALGKGNKPEDVRAVF